ncbi:MAG TPA: 1,2-phenylacetyl-CoA epoxidase subunit PaaC [Ideonella sp.]|nr:1,2-phenylacetyl-CoA epoxidase subunit PaaC [Ideonella sp.]
MSTPSITWQPSLSERYLLRLADTCLIHAQRGSEWCGHAPILEEDIALTNMSLDLVGQARGLLTHVGQLSGHAFDEDQLAFLREERDYLNLTLAELPGRKAGRDFADTVLRNLMVGTWLHLVWQRLQASSDAEVAAIAGKAVKEARYHREHAAGWVVRLGDGSEESARRMQKAVAALWPYSAELFEADEVDAHAVATGLGPARAELREPWGQAMREVLAEAQCTPPADSAFRSTGTRGVHSEHLGYMLAEMQSLQRAYPGGKW